MATASIQTMANYVLSSELKDVRVTVSGATSVRMTVVCGSDTLLSLVLDVYDGTVILYDLRSVVEEYLRNGNITFGSITINVSEIAGNNVLATKTVKVIYCDLNNASGVSLLLNRFLTTLTSKISHTCLLERLSFFAKTNETLCEQYTVVSEGNGVFTTHTFSINSGQTANADNVNEIIIDCDEIATQHNISGRIASITVVVGNRSFTFYYSQKEPCMGFALRNAFNVYEICAIDGVTEKVCNVERSTAVIGGKSEFYDQTVTDSFKVESAPLQYETAVWIRQLFTSHKVFLHEHNDDTYDYPILITESKCEISDENGELNKVSFTWQHTDGKQYYNHQLIGLTT